MMPRILAPLFLLLILAVSPAIADDKTARQEAGELAAQSAKHYKRGEFEQAAALLREAHAKFPEPVLLYNLARALEGVGNRQGAIDAYERYLKDAKKIEDRGAIERRVATLRAELEAKQTKPDPKPDPIPEPTPEPEPVITAPLVREEPPREPERSRSKLPWIAIASGVAIIATGGVMAYRARSNDDKARDEMTSGEDAQKFHDRAERDALIANILFGVGGATVVAGVVFAW